jgi:cell wall-associated NlpC family hydrolase
VNRKAAGSAGLGVALIILLFFLTIPMLIIGGTSLLFAGGGGSGCANAPSQPAQQPSGSVQANSIPANYLMWYKKVGLQYNIPWTILAGIGTEESDNGQTTLPGVHSGQNGFGAAGPMQIGIDGASGDAWGGGAFPGQGVIPGSSLPVPNGGVATDEDGLGSASVYDPADAIAGAAKYLIAHGFAQSPSGAIFAYNHAGWYVTAVLNFASSYAAGGFTVSQVQPAPAVTPTSSGGCAGTVLDALHAPNMAVAVAIKFAQEQIGKPYLFGGTGPDSFDCSGLVEMAYRAAGVNIPRTADEQFHFGPPVAASAVSPGDLVFFAGADGTPAAPGHVGLVIGKNTMIEAYATGFPVRVSTFGQPGSPGGERAGQVVGFTRPWAHSGLNVPASELATPTPSATGQPSGTPSHPVQPTRSGQPTTLPSTAPKPTTLPTRKA